MRRYMAGRQVPGKSAKARVAFGIRLLLVSQYVLIGILVLAAVVLTLSR